MSEFIWSPKEENKDYSIEWSILEKVPKFRPGNKFCNLCVSEKRHILLADTEKTLNKRDEFVTKCRHQNKFKLINIKDQGKIDLLAHTYDQNTKIPTYDLTKARNRMNNKIPRNNQILNSERNLKQCSLKLRRLSPNTINKFKPKTNENSYKTKFQSQKIVDTQYSQRGRERKPNTKFYNSEWIT